MTTTAYTPALAAKLCAAIAEGKSLRAVCAMKGMPSRATVYRWLRDDASFAKLYEQATDDRVDGLVDEIVEIADKCKPDKASVAKAKLQIYARVESAQKMKPRKYGQKVTQELVGAGGGAIQVQTAAALTDDQLAAIAAGTPCS